MKKTKWMVKVAMLSAVAVVLMLIEFPLPFLAPPFYKLDFSEIPVLLGTFALGPVAGVVIEFLKVLINTLIEGTTTMGVGEAANFVVGVSYILPAGLIYKKFKTKKSATLGMIAGGATMIVLGAFLNAFILIPVYAKAFGKSVEDIVNLGKLIFPAIDNVAKLVIFCVVPFNLIKVVLVSLITRFIYKPLSPLLKGKQ